MSVLVIGAGLAGLACARGLAAAGLAVTVVDKARGPGGRLSTRRSAGRAFDHGAQYFRLRDASLTPLLATLHAAGIVAPWRARLVTLRDGGSHARDDAATRYVGVPGMSAVARALGAALSITYGSAVTALTRGADGWTATTDAGTALPGRFAAVVVATPAAQAVPLLAAAPALATRVAAVEVDPCWATMVGFAAPLAVAIDAAFVESGPLAWIARNSSKPERPPDDAWVLHASPQWSSLHLEDPPDTAAAALLAAFAAALARPLPTPRHVAAHRWRYARTRTPLGAAFLYDAQLGLGACGDWCLGATVECALLSGAALADAMR